MKEATEEFIGDKHQTRGSTGLQDSCGPPFVEAANALGTVYLYAAVAETGIVGKLTEC